MNLALFAFSFHSYCDFFTAFCLPLRIFRIASNSAWDLIPFEQEQFNKWTKDNGRSLTLKAWRERLKPGMKLRCVYRWYWGAGKPAPSEGFEICAVLKVRATQTIMRTPTVARSYMRHPRSRELRAHANGFEIYFPKDPKWGERSGMLMSRYEYTP